MKRILFSVAPLLLFLLAGSCRGGGGGNPPPPPPPQVFDVVGMIRNVAGDLIPGATVLLGNEIAVSGTDGKFQFNDLPAGQYAVTAYKTGYHYFSGIASITSGFTLQVKLAALTAPVGFQVSEVSPNLGEMGVQTDKVIEFLFSEPLDPQYATASRITFSPSIGTFKVGVSGNQLTITSDRKLPTSKKILLTVSSSIRSSLGISLPNDFRTLFTVSSVDTAPLRLVSSEPADDAQDVSPLLSPVLTFNEELSAASLSEATISISPQVSVTPRVDGNRLVLDLPEQLSLLTTFTVMVSGLKDKNGNGLESDITFSFKTAAAIPRANSIEPDWNQFTNRITFASDRDGNYDIFTMKADGTDARKITSSSSNEFHPRFSYDGTLIVFSSLRSGNEDIYLIGSDGNGESRLTSHPSSDREPDFSGTSSLQILFSTNRNGVRFSLYSMNADGSAQVDSDSFFSSNSTMGAFHPYLDTYLAFVSDRSGNPDIYLKILSFIGGTAQNTNLTSNLVSRERYPAWSPDGQTIAFISDQPGVDNIWVTSVDGALPRQLTFYDKPIQNPVFSPNLGENLILASVKRAEGNYDLALFDTVTGQMVRWLTQFSP